MNNKHANTPPTESDPTNTKRTETTTSDDEDGVTYPWSSYQNLELSELRQRLGASEVGTTLLGTTCGGDDAGDKHVLAKILYAAETNCRLRFDGMYYCGHLCHADGLGNVYMRFHPDGFVAVTKVFEKDINEVYNNDLARNNSEEDAESLQTDVLEKYRFGRNTLLHHFNYTCTLVTSNHGARYGEDMFEITFTPINDEAIQFHNQYGAHPNAYVNATTGEFYHRYTDHNWTHTRRYKFAEFK